MPNTQRSQISATISPAIHDELEKLSIRTGLSRSRLFDIALTKFVAWAEIVDDVVLRRISAEISPHLGYARRESGFRRSSSTPAPSAAVFTKQDPYHPVPAKPLPKAASGGKK